jgi:hypothetical protein
VGDDVVEQGVRGRWSGAPPWLHRGVLTVLALLAVATLGHLGLLSSDRPTPSGAPTLTGPPPVVPTPTDMVPHVLAREGRRLVRYGATGAVIVARLPADLSAAGPLVAVETADGHGAVLGVAGGQLFRVDLRGGRVTRLGPAQALFGAPRGWVFALVGHGPDAGVVAASTDTGRVLEPEPFPGFRAGAGWTPRASLSALGTVGLLLSRPAADGDFLAVAWIRGQVAAGQAPRVQPLGSFGRLLGTSGDWVLVLEGTCPGRGCRVKIISLTRDRVLMRDVRPPPGWSFAGRLSPGPTYGAVVPVVLLADPGITGLARLVPGGRHALLIEGSEGVEADAGILEQPEGDVYFARQEGLDHWRLARWRPLQPGVTTLAELPPVPPGARLVCVCG